MVVPQKDSPNLPLLDSALSELRAHPIATIGRIIAAVTGLVVLLVMTKLHVPTVIFITAMAAYNLWLGFSMCRRIWRSTTRESFSRTIVFPLLLVTLLVVTFTVLSVALWQDVRIIKLLPDSEAVAEQLTRSTYIARIANYGFILAMLVGIAVMVTTFLKMRALTRGLDLKRADR